MQATNQPSHPATPRIAVIGGGLGGLVCANHLVDLPSRPRVTIFESSEAFGGRGRTQPVSGAALNFGPHALYRKGFLARQLQDWGIELTGGTPRDVRGLVGDELHRLPDGPLSLATTGLLAGWARFRFAAAMFSIMRTEPREVEGENTSAFIAGLTDDVRVVRTLSALARLSTYAADLEELSADAFVAQMKLSIGGVVYLDGGWQQMVDALVDRLGRTQAELRPGQPVSAVEAGERVSRSQPVSSQPVSSQPVRLQVGDSSRCFDAAVIATSPGAARRLLGKAQVASAGLDFRPRSIRAACLDLVMRAWPKHLPDLALGVDSPVYVSNHSRAATLSDRGLQVVHASRYLSHSDELDAAQSRESIEAALDSIYPGWRGAVVESRYLPKMTVVEHASSAENSGMSGRPAVSHESLAGLYFVGDWCGRRGWLSNAAAASADTAAELIGRRFAPRLPAARIA